MHLKTRNINTAFKELIEVFTNQSINHQPDIIREKSRNGNVMRIAEPVTITYSHPRERVLLNKARAANPFFHMYEALHMLAGRNDIAPLAYYNSKMMEFSDDGVTQNGAYGYRWRNARADAGLSTHYNYDQLDILVEHLKNDPTSRRAVLQMWNVEDDLLKIGGICKECHGMGIVPDTSAKSYVKGEGHKVCTECKGLSKGSKDTCCNLSVMFSIREKEVPPDHVVSFLDMTVTNRSNDLIWGLLGANYCHFSFLQEYMAARLGCEVGVYNHFTNNLHVYDWNWKPDEWLAECNQAPFGKEHTFSHHRGVNVFEEELVRFVEENVNNKRWSSITQRFWQDPFLCRVAQPLMNVFHAYKVGHKIGQTIMDHSISGIQSVDWQMAAIDWLNARPANKVEVRT